MPTVRNVFGGGIEDFVQDRYGNAVGPTASNPTRGQFPVWLNTALTVPALDLLDRNGAPLTTGYVIPNAAGFFRFSGPVGVTVLYVPDGSGDYLTLRSDNGSDGTTPLPQIIVVDLGGGVLSLTGSGVVNNGDGTVSLTAATNNGDGTVTLPN